MTANVIEQYSWNVSITKGGTPVSPDFPRVYGIRQPNLAPADVVINQLVDATGSFASDLDVTAAEIEVNGDISTITDRNPYEIRFLSYGNRFITFNKSFSVASVDLGFLETDPVVTETDKATVLAYPGYTKGASIDIVSGLWNPVRLYDRTQAEDVDTPTRQNFPALTSVDGVTFQSVYALLIQNIPFDGGGAVYSLGSVVASGVGLAITDVTFPDVFLGDTAQLNWQDVNIPGEFDIFGDTPGPTTYNLTNCTINIVSTDEGQPITVNLLGTATIATNNDPVDITIVNAKSVTIRALDFNTGLPIQFARVYLKEVGGADIIPPGTLTDINGEVTVTYNLVGVEQDVEGFVAKGTESPTYKRAPLGGTITGDFLQQVSLQPDGA